MRHQSISRSVRSDSLLATHQVLRNTYLLLGLTILFSACTASLAIAFNAPPAGILGMLLMFGLLFLVQFTAKSVWGLPSTFLFTGYMGYALGPIVGFYLHGLSNGGAIVATALGATGLIFLALSSYVLATRKDFSYMGGFLFAGIMTVFIMSLGSLFLNMPFLSLAISCAFTLLCSGLILFHTSNIIHGGERNYILATISLYVALYNLFLSLLQILAAFAGSRD